MTLVTQSAFANWHGVSRKTVTLWKTAGRLVFVGDEVDFEASDARLRDMRLGKFRDRPRSLPAADTRRPGNSAGNALTKAERSQIARRSGFSPDAFLILNVVRTVWPGLMRRAVLHFGGGENAAGLAVAALSELVDYVVVETHDTDGEAGFTDLRDAFPLTPALDWSPTVAARIEGILVSDDPAWFDHRPEGAALADEMLGALGAANRSMTAHGRTLAKARR